MLSRFSTTIDNERVYLVANYRAICRRRVDYARILKIAKILTKPKLNPCEHGLANSTVDSVAMTKSDNENEPALLPQDWTQE